MRLFAEVGITGAANPRRVNARSERPGPTAGSEPVATIRLSLKIEDA
jgi:hypothetical protein